MAALQAFMVEVVRKRKAAAHRKQASALAGRPAGRQAGGQAGGQPFGGAEPASRWQPCCLCVRSGLACLRLTTAMATMAQGS